MQFCKEFLDFMGGSGFPGPPFFVASLWHDFAMLYRPKQKCVIALRKPIITGRAQQIMGGRQGTRTPRFALTAASDFTLDYIAPGAAISDYVTTFYWFRCDQPVIRDIQPAAIGHLSLFARGEGTMHFPGDVHDRSHRLNLLTPSSMASPFEVAGPLHAIGAALTPLGWAALTGMSAKQNANRLLDAEAALGAKATDLAERACAGYLAGDIDGHGVAKMIADLLLETAKPISDRHARLITATNRWLGASLDPQVDDLFAQASYSQRQVQRLVERYFGLPPKALVRKYRALRAAMLMSLPTLSPEMEGELGEAFYDQSHMIREIQRFVGRTPVRLGTQESPFLTEMLDAKNFREIGGT